MQYASLWVKDGTTEWALWRDLTAGLYQDKFDKMTAAGMRPASIGSYAVSGQVLYAAAFVKNSTAGWAAHHGQSSEQHQATFNTHTAQGFRMVSVSGCALGANIGFSSIWVKNTENLGWSTRHGLTAQQHGQYFQEMKNRGYRPICISAFAVNNSPRYSSIWVKNDGTAWSMWSDQTASQYQATATQQSAAGMRPISLSTYAINGEVHYASVWTKNTNSLGWAARHGQSNDQDLQTFTQLREQGFHPICVGGVDPTLTSTVPTPSVGSQPVQITDGKARLDFGSFKTVNQWRFCPDFPLHGGHPFGDTRDQWIDLWIDVEYPTVGDIVDTIRDCAIGAGVVALGTAIATEGSATAVAIATFKASAMLCLKVKLGEVVAKKVKIHPDWETRTGDWSGH